MSVKILDVFFQDLYYFIFIIKYSFGSSCWGFFEDSFSMSFLTIPLTIIFIAVTILYVTIPFLQSKFILSKICCFQACFYSITVGHIILELKIAAIFKCPVAIFDAMLVPAPAPPISNTLFCDSMQFIFMPFSNNIYITISIFQYSQSLFQTLCIKVTSVLFIIFFMLLFNIYEPVLDGLKFRLEQPLMLKFMGDVKNSIWLHLEAVVDLQCFLGFCLHDLFKTLMSGSWCLVVMSH